MAAPVWRSGKPIHTRRGSSAPGSTIPSA